MSALCPYHLEQRRAQTGHPHQKACGVDIGIYGVLAFGRGMDLGAGVSRDLGVVVSAEIGMTLGHATLVSGMGMDLDFPFGLAYAWT